MLIFFDLGIKEMEIQYLPMHESIITNSELDSFELINLILNENEEKKNLKKNYIKIPNDLKKVFSKTLLSKLIIEQCKGDFCEYEFLEQARGVLKQRKIEYIGKNQLNSSQKLLGSLSKVIFIKLSYLFFFYYI